MRFGPLPDFSSKMPILNCATISSIPLAMLQPFRKKAFLYYGRKLDRIAEHRGLTVWEALELLHNSGTMPPKSMAVQALLGEVSIYQQCVAEGLEYGPGNVAVDYSDCDRVTLKGNLEHLKYTKMVRHELDIGSKEDRPLILFMAMNTGRAYSMENGVRIDRTAEISPHPIIQSHQPARDRVTRNAWEAQAREVEGKISSLYDAIKHGDEDHQEWLKEAIRCHFAGLPMPEYKAGKSSKYIHREGEPFFVLLGRDPQAPDKVEEWADVRALAEPGDWKVENARQIARDMRLYKAANPTVGMSEALYQNALTGKLAEADTQGEKLRRLYTDAAKEVALDKIPTPHIPQLIANTNLP